MLIFVTGNAGKFREASAIFPQLRQEPFDFDEPRGSLEEVAKRKAQQAYAHFKKPLFVEDSGLFIDALNGFPGEFSAWVLSKLSLEDICALVEDKPRTARMLSVVAYIDEEGVKTFKGEVRGRISTTPRGEGGFGYDPIFVPEGHEKTFGEDEGLKRNLSHRYYSLMALKDFLSQR